MPRPAHRRPLQQPVVRLRRLLPPEGHQAAPGELQRRAGEPHQGHRGEQSHTQGFHRRPCPGPRGLLQLHRREYLQCRRGKGGRDRRFPPDDEVQFRQLPPVRHPGHHETHQGQGREGDRVRAHARRRQHLLRLQGRQRPRGLQSPGRRHYRQPLRPRPGRRPGQSLHPRYF